MPRPLKIATLALIVFALYNLIGFWILPVWMQKQVEKATERDAFEQAHIEGISFNPYTFRLVFSGVSASGKDRQWTFESEIVAVDLSARSLLAWQPILDAVEIATPRLAVRRSSDFVDFSDEAASSSEANDLIEGKGILRQLRIGRFSVTDGTFHYTDGRLERTYEEKLHPIRFVLLDLSAETESPSKIRFTAKTEADGQLEWESELSRAPFMMDGKFQLSDLRLERLSPYYAHFLGFTVDNARLDLEAKYTLDPMTSEDWLRIHEGVVQLRDVRFSQKKGSEQENLFRIDQIKAEAFNYKLPENKLTVETIQANGGQTAVWRGQENELNWSRALKLKSRPDTNTNKSISRHLFQYQIDTVSIHDHSIDWSPDASKPASDLKLSLQSLETSNVSSDFSAPVEVSAHLKIGSKGSAKIEGSLLPDNLAPSLSLELKSFPLHTVEDFLAPNILLEKADGSLDFTGRLETDASKKLLLMGDGSAQTLDFIYRMPPKLFLQGTRLNVSGLKLRFRPFLIEMDKVDAEKLSSRVSGGAESKQQMQGDALEWFQFESASASALAYDASDNELQIETLSLSDGKTTAWQIDSRKKIRVIPSFVPPSMLNRAVGNGNDIENPKRTPFTFSLTQFNVSGGTIDWVRHPESILILNVKIPELSAQNLSSDPSQRFSLDGEARFPEGGSLSLQGDLRLKNPEFDWSVQVEQLPLTFLTDLFGDLAELKIASGHFSFDGQLESGTSAGNRSSGQGSIKSFSAQYTGYPQIKAEWNSFRFSGLDLVGRPLTVNVQSAELNQPEFVVTWPEKSASKEKDESKKSDWSGLTIGSARVRDGKLTLIDSGVKPAIDIPLGDLSVTLEDFRLDAENPAAVQLDATVPQGSILVEGELHPLRFRKATSLDIEIEDLNLPQISPYASKGLGRSIQEGTVDIESDWFVDDGSLDASNDILIDQLNLGPPTDGSASSKVPIRLVTQMLKSPEGKIEFRLPVSGDLDNPSIRFAGIVRKALARQLTDIATSPFRRLSSLVGAIRFAPGAGQLPDSMHKRLDVLAAAMDKDPQLDLEIIPQITPQDIKSIEDKGILAKTVNVVVPDIVVPASERQLAEKRMDAIRKYLIEEKGIDAARISLSEFEQVKATPGVRFELE